MPQLERVGLSADAAALYPGQFSGGQRQRIAIARALMLSPRLVICDEPLSALDLSVQAQVLNLLKALQRELGVGYLFITHDLAVVPHIAHRVVVLYRGQVMETGPAARSATIPATPTPRLISAAPVPDPAQQRARRDARTATTRSRPAPAAAPSPTAARTPSTSAAPNAPPCAPPPGGTTVACHRYAELHPAPQESAQGKVPLYDCGDDLRNGRGQGGGQRGGQGRGVSGDPVRPCAALRPSAAAGAVDRRP